MYSRPRTGNSASEWYGGRSRSSPEYTDTAAPRSVSAAMTARSARSDCDSASTDPPTPTTWMFTPRSCLAAGPYSRTGWAGHRDGGNGRGAGEAASGRRPAAWAGGRGPGQRGRRGPGDLLAGRLRCGRTHWRLGASPAVLGPAGDPLHRPTTAGGRVVGTGCRGRSQRNRRGDRPPRCVLRLSLIHISEPTR